MTPSPTFSQRLRDLRVAAPLFLLAILAMVILPMPPVLLDVLFTFNIVLALVVILVSVNSKRPLDFSIFPSVILATTLMRLSLNVASTRVVLLHGHEGTHAAGKVIESFGNVVIGGNFIVGLVVFVILMVVNFIVVTKGAERISEVSARFTLDALPGKQMAIDADLNAGLINQEQAQKRRKEVGTEADFYGAMDGASKFVRGDAIASILILLINLIGGVAIGAIMHGLSLGEAIRQYGLLTIGDGLVAQIPALLLSAAAAIIVTRVSDSGQLETQVSEQMLASPQVLYSAAGVMMVLALIPGMPWMAFSAFAIALGYAAWRMSRAPRDKVQPAAPVAAALVTAAPPDMDWRALPVVEAVSVSLGFKLVSLIDPAQGAPLQTRVRGMRQSLSETLGVLLPTLQVRDDLSLKPNQYAISLSGAVVAQAELYPDRLMAIASGQIYGDVDGIPGFDPAYGMPVTWITPEDKAHALGLGYQVVDVPSVVATHVSKVVREQLPELLRFDDMAALVERLNAIAPKLGAALDKAYTHAQLLKVIRLLLTEGVSVKDIQTIASTLVENAEATKDPILLAAEIRCALKRQIVAHLQGPQQALGSLKVFNLGSELENHLLNALNQARAGGAKVQLDSFPVDPQLLSQLQQHMPGARDQMKAQGSAPALLVMPQVRPLLARYARLFAPGLAVLSYNEVPDQKEIAVVGTLG
ncbi:flagellar biosynthesis protein FlhA [Roseateles sp. SL47]|jgi:flagellar biosynthesis protein FlhA|uniref:flagellar biosynthesis protein FlhA n=1 Tax=Roseateles sp. SL47 TaxID=2995138 RepID=UPI00226FDE91|nr:flagellar biosynthesis protein FlhA [Roseateles sp. SL47]WAC75528.1 flagellar biosynthesis protein FlhA [Roseateles sp. SL47]